MADEKIQVEVVGKTDQLNSSMSGAGNTVQSAMDRIRSSFSGVTSSGQNLGNFLTGLAGGVIGGALVAAGDAAIAMLKNLGQAFVQTVTHARDFALENQKAAAILGDSYKNVAALRLSLDQTGKSLEDYTGMVMRMTQRLKTSEQAWQSYGMKTRDANGALLQGRDLMQSAISTMQTYKSGVDQNSFALEVFGRSASQVYDYMRLTNAELENSARLVEEFGIRTSGAAEQAQAFSNAQNELGDITEAFSTRIGEMLLPTLTHWMEMMAGPLKEALLAILPVIQDIIAFLEMLAGAFYQTAQVAIGAAEAILNSLQAAANMGGALNQALSGDFEGAGQTISNSFGKIGSDLDARFKNMEQGAKDTVSNIKSIYGDFSETDLRNKDVVVPGKGGSKEFTPADNESKSGGKQQDEQVQLYKKFKQQEIQTDRETAQIKEQIAKQSNDNDLALGKINAQQHKARAKEISDAEYQSARQALERKVQLAGNDTLAKQKALDELKLLELKHQQEIGQIEAQGATKSKAIGAAAVKDHKLQQDQKVKDVKAANNAIEKDVKETATNSSQSWKGMLSSVTGSFGNAIKGMIHGTMTWKEALGSIIDSVVDSFIDMGIELLTNWLTTSIEKLFITKATESVAASSSIAASAAQAGAAAFASTAAIPITGPAAAPAAGAAAYAGAMSYQGLAFAEKGMVVDRDRLVFAHKDEQVLPSNISKGLTNIISRGGDMNKGGDNNLTYSPTINSQNAKSLEQQLADEGRAMMGWLMKQKRNGMLKFT